MKVSGFLDAADHARIRGWARDEDASDRAVVLLITDNGELVARVVANTFRPDLLALGAGNQGRLGFDVGVALSPLVRHRIEVISEVTGEQLTGSPVVLEPASAFDEACKTAIAKVMASATTESEIAERLAFLASQTEAVLRLNDRRQVRENERAALQALTWRADGPVAERNAASVPPKPRAAAHPARRALVIDLAMPVIERDAGSVALLSHMSSLQRLDYAVTFLPTDLRGDTAPLERRGILALTRPWYASVEEALARNDGAFDLVYLHRTESAIPYLPLVRCYQPNARIVFSVADLSSVRTQRQAEIEERPELLALARRRAAMEIAAGRQADAVITHSSFEASILEKAIDARRVHVVPFAVADRPTLVPFGARNGLAFIGSFSHRPNVDAARWLADMIMPKVAASHPAIACLVVGSAMPEHIRHLANDGFIPVGAVDDLSSIFDRVRLTIAPLAFGAGVKGKVISSLAAGIPCVCTPVAAEGLDLPPLLQGLVASEPAALAELVVRLHEDDRFNAECSSAGLDYIAAHASEEAVDAAMKRAVDFVSSGERQNG